MRKHLLNTVLILQIFSAFCPAFATISVHAFSREEANETNHTKPRIYIMNTGTETISDMYYCYYFEVENDKTPEYQVYWAPNHIINLEYLGGSLYRIKYTLTGTTVAPGAMFVAPDGNVIGIHYTDWSPWNKTNDFSYNGSTNFLENPNIAVYVNGTRVYGNEPIDSTPSVFGSVYREVWTGVSGVTIDSIPVNKAPAWTGTQSSLESPRNQGNNYGARMCGYITAPESGNYTFWISSDDFSEFWISTDSLPSNKEKVAWVSGYCDFHQWNKYSTQKSGLIFLVKDNRYYIEILHKEGEQDDHCSVGWIKPSESDTIPSEIVPSRVLSPHIPKVLPAVPTSLTATAKSPFRINLSWTDQSWNESGFILEFKEDGGRFTEFDSVAANQTKYQVNGLSPNTRYCFRIRAYNSTGKSDYSDSSCVATGSALTGTATRELWTNVTGIEISDIPLSNSPDKIDSMTVLESFQQWGNKYGQRIRGYITAPLSGTYYFWISSDDYSQLWLSSDTNPSTKVMIASVSGYTNFREWNKYPSQKSSAITLTGGEKYYFEILHKEGEQNDNMSVGWLKPGESGSQPSEIIPSWVLSPYIIPSIVLAPNGDSDNDGISNGIEVYGPVKTDPNDSTSFVDYVIPSKTILDYSVENRITLDFARFYPGYSKSTTIPFSIEAGAFSGNLAPLFQMRSIPKGMSEIPRVPGYSPIGLAMNFEYFPIVPGKEVEIPLPFTNTQIINGTECFMVIRKNDSCDIVHPTSVNSGYLTVTVDSTVKSIILIQKSISFGTAVAYLDGGMIYSQDNGTSISTNIVLRNCQPQHGNGSLMKVFYTDISDPFNPVNDSVLFPLDTIKENGSYLLKNSDIVHFAGAIRVTGITIDVPQCSVYNVDSTIYNISRGQSLALSCDWNVNSLGSIEKPVSASYEINYALESVSIDGEGRILQHRTGDSVTYSYDYYLKDHLGSTRMVINDQNSITEKVAYQSYGTINQLDSSSPALPSREKFTGKEFDTQGADFARVEFDISLTDFDMSAGSGFIRVTYNDVASNNRFSKRYDFRYDSKERALKFTGSESFTSEVEIKHIQLIAAGVSDTIFNTVAIDSFVVSPGKTRKIQLNVPMEVITAAPSDSNLYSMHTAMDNTSYFSGMRLFYFGARYYDPELGIWLSVDPAGQFWNTYGYHTNPNKYIDPNGESFWSFIRWAFPVTNMVLTAASAGNAAFSQDNFERGVAAFFADIGANELFNSVGPMFEGINITVNFFANWGSDKWATTFKSIWDNENSSLQNAFSSENFGDFASSLNQSGFNSFTTSMNNFHYQWHSNQKYYGRIEDTHGFSAVVWGRPGEGKNNATTNGNNIVLEQYFYDLPSITSEEYISGSCKPFRASQEATFRHEFIHVRQGSWYGTGGSLVKQTYGKYRRDYTPGTFEYEAIDRYGNSPGWIDMLEFDAQSHEHSGKSDKYWFDVYNQIKF